MKKYLISDFYFKASDKIKDYLLKIKWILVLGRIGPGSYLRFVVKIIGNPRRINVGSNFKAYQKVIIAIGEWELHIGNNGLISVGTYINCGNERLSIGDNVAIAPFCKTFTYSHHYQTAESTINSYKTGDVVIGDAVLIGTNTIILPGITIGRSSIVAANSLINKDVDPFTIVGDSPAKFIKMKRG